MSFLARSRVCGFLKPSPANLQTEPLMRSGAHPDNDHSVSRLIVVSMLDGVMFCRFFRMVSRKNLVSMRGMSMMPCGFVIAGLMMLGRLQVMPSGMSVVFSCLLVMLRALVMCHFCFPLAGCLSLHFTIPGRLTASGSFSKADVRALTQNGLLVVVA